MGYYGASALRDEVYICMELCECSLFQLFSVGLTFSEEQIRMAMKETLLAVAHLHSVNVIHRDIKSANILVSSNGHIKLTDFGASAILENAAQRRQTIIGTPYFMPPEQVANLIFPSPYGKEIDIWSVGITAYEIAEKGKTPLCHFKPMKAIHEIAYRASPTLKSPKNWSREMNEFVAQCLIKEPQNRANAQQLLSGAWLKPALKQDLMPLVNDYRLFLGNRKHDEDEPLEANADEVGNTIKTVMKRAARAPKARALDVEGAVEEILNSKLLKENMREIARMRAQHEVKRVALSKQHASTMSKFASADQVPPLAKHAAKELAKLKKQHESFNEAWKKKLRALHAKVTAREQEFDKLIGRESKGALKSLVSAKLPFKSNEEAILSAKSAAAGKLGGGGTGGSKSLKAFVASERQLLERHEAARSTLLIDAAQPITLLEVACRVVIEERLALSEAIVQHYAARLQAERKYRADVAALEELNQSEVERAARAALAKRHETELRLFDAMCEQQRNDLTEIQQLERRQHERRGELTSKLRAQSNKTAVKRHLKQIKQAKRKQKIAEKEIAAAFLGRLQAQQQASDYEEAKEFAEQQENARLRFEEEVARRKAELCEQHASQINRNSSSALNEQGANDESAQKYLESLSAQLNGEIARAKDALAERRDEVLAALDDMCIAQLKEEEDAFGVAATAAGAESNKKPSKSDLDLFVEARLQEMVLRSERVLMLYREYANALTASTLEKVNALSLRVQQTQTERVRLFS